MPETHGGHRHPHAGSPAPVAGARTGLLVAAALIPVAVLAALAMILLWPTGDRGPRTGLGLDVELAKGTVTSVRAGECGSPDPAACPEADVRLTAGSEAGSTVRTPAPSGPAAPQLSPGDKVVLTYAPSSPQGFQYAITDFQRGRPLLALAILFALVVVGFGRLRGLAALGGLVVTFVVLVQFVLPAILDGSSPLLVALVGAAVIMFLVLYLTHGISVCTSVAVLGTLGALSLTGLLGILFTTAADFSGLTGEGADVIGGLYPQVDVRGLLLAGIVIGSLGVLDDVTVTQSFTVAELARADPSMSRVQLYRAAARVGRAHVASTVNTLVLAYAGASLPLLLLFTAGGRSTADLLTSELVATEVVRGAVGSIGIVAAVPLTTWLAVLLLPERTGSGRRRAP